jgi:hypothetical protein
VPTGFRCGESRDRRPVGIGAAWSTDPWFTTSFPSGRAIGDTSGSVTLGHTELAYLLHKINF